jgi:general secretion pathway protein I
MIGRFRPSRKSDRRRGMTLLEVFLALAIFIGALAVITQIISTGSRAAIQAQLQSDAVLRAESVISEAVSGVIPLQSASGQAFADDSTWTWSLTVAEGTHVDTLQLTAVIDHKLPTGRINAQATLTRLVRDPQVFLDAAGASSTTSGLELLK